MLRQDEESKTNKERKKKELRKANWLRFGRGIHICHFIYSFVLFLFFILPNHTERL